ncbi:unnamed protein product [Urochloa humidicola]
MLVRRHQQPGKEEEEEGGDGLSRRCEESHAIGDKLDAANKARRRLAAELKLSWTPSAPYREIDAAVAAWIDDDDDMMAPHRAVKNAEPKPSLPRRLYIDLEPNHEHTSF